MNPKNNQPTFPLPSDDQAGSNPAADLVRTKLESIYSHEPDVVSEAIESVVEPEKQRSKHQRKMYELATSGKSMAQIQTEWHEYYAGLDNKEKHEVWKEFYDTSQHTAPKPEPVISEQPSPYARMPSQIVSQSFEPVQPAGKPASIADLKRQLTSKVRKNGKLNRRQHFQSLAFGLATGSLVVLVMLFSFFNERFIAPFITPSRNVSATPLIVDENGPVGPESKVIIPKINVELPVVYDTESIDEDTVQTALERGVVHYATTANPGEKGNSVIFGHSSNNILNKGKYKFAFVLLNRLEIDDTFYLQKDGKRYVYKVFEKKVVKPTEIDVLDPKADKPSVATLITCDPPGTSINRLVVVGEQISPSPDGNAESTALKTDQKPKELASNSESLWHRIWSGIF